MSRLQSLLPVGRVAELGSLGVMIRTRIILATFGLILSFIWVLTLTVALVVIKHWSLTDLFACLFLFIVFAFYALITLRPCRAVTAFVLGLVLHVPLSYFIVRSFKIGYPVVGVVLLFGVIVWAIYVIQLRRHENA